MEKGNSLASMVFVGSSKREQIVPVKISLIDDASRTTATAHVRKVCEATEADFVLMVCEAWSLLPQYLSRYEEILERYGSLSACPASWRAEVVSITMETRFGTWAAQPRIVPKGASKKRRTFGEPVFVFSEYTEGRLSNMLPPLPEQGSGVAS